MVWLVPQWFNVDLLRHSRAEKLLPTAAWSLATQHATWHPGAQPEHAPIRDALTPSNATGDQSGPDASQRVQAPNIFIDLIIGSGIRLTQPLVRLLQVLYPYSLPSKKYFMEIVSALASRYLSFLSNVTSYNLCWGADWEIAKFNARGAAVWDSGRGDR